MPGIPQRHSAVFGSIRFACQFSQAALLWDHELLTSINKHATQVASFFSIGNLEAPITETQNPEAQHPTPTRHFPPLDRPSCEHQKPRNPLFSLSPRTLKFSAQGIKNSGLLTVQLSTRYDFERGPGALEKVLLQGLTV